MSAAATFIIAALLSSNVEVGLGASGFVTKGFGRVDDAALVGTGMSTSIRAGDRLLFTATVDGGLTDHAFPLSNRLIVSARPLGKNLLFAVGGAGIGWRFLDHERATVGITAIAFAGLLPSQGVDFDIGPSPSIGVAPGAFATWRMTSFFGLTARATIQLGLSQPVFLALSPKPYPSAIVVLEPTLFSERDEDEP